MNVADKAGLYREARRVLASGDRLAIWDITLGEGEPEYPLPWADRPELSHLATSERIVRWHRVLGIRNRALERSTDQAGSIMQTQLTLPPKPLGLHAFVTSLTEKAKNLTEGLADGRLRAIQGTARATGAA